MVLYFIFYILHYIPMLNQVLQEYGLSAKEASLYLACLELGSAPVSSIARRLGENRVTTYSNLKNLVKRGIVNETIKNKAMSYVVVPPQDLLDKLQKKYDLLKEKMPEFLAIASKYDNKPQVQLFEWLEGLKNLYEGVISHWWEWMDQDEPYLTFTGSGDMDPGLQSYFVDTFIPWRLKFPRKTHSILAGKSDNKYVKYHTQSHKYLEINDPVFVFADEIIIYGRDKVAIIMYNTNELCWLVISSITLHDGLKSMFSLIWKLSKKNKSVK